MLQEDVPFFMVILKCYIEFYPLEDHTCLFASVSNVLKGIPTVNETQSVKTLLVMLLP